MSQQVTITSISLQPKFLTMSIGLTESIGVVVRRSDNSVGTASDVNWASSAPNVAEVSATGTVTAKSVGTAVISASGGTVSNSSKLIVAPNFTTTTYQSGSMLFIENTAGADVVRLGADLSLGGAVDIFALNGNDVVAKAYYGSHLIAVGLFDADDTYDSCYGCQGLTGWNPTESCDYYRHGSPILAENTDGNSLYVKNHALEWLPDNKGGGPNQPVLSDVVMERWFSAVPNHPFVFKEKYKITHVGQDHAVPSYEINAQYNRWSFYSGTAPGTGGALTTIPGSTIPQWPTSTPVKWLSERFGALVNSQDFGIGAFSPQAFPYANASMATTDPTDEVAGFVFLTPFSFSPGNSVEFTTYLMLGDVHTMQQEAYDIARREGPWPDIAPPVGDINDNAPAKGAKVSGTIAVEGYAFDSVSSTTLDLLVDGIVVATGFPNIRRDDIVQAFPGAPSNSAFHFDLDTTKYSNGQHVIQVKATDASGNIGFLPRRVVTVQN